MEATLWEILDTRGTFGKKLKLTLIVVICKYIHKYWFLLPILLRHNWHTALYKFMEKEMAAYSSVLATDRGAWWATVHGVSEESGTDIETKWQLYKFKVCSIMIWLTHIMKRLPQ